LMKIDEDPLEDLVLVC